MCSNSQAHRLLFQSSYRQFYVVDRDVPLDTARADFWTDEALHRGLAVADGVLGIGTSSSWRIRCFFQLADSEPCLPLSAWERVVEGSIRLTTGRYAVVNCCVDDSVAHEGQCAPGDYRLRVHAAFLDQEVEGSVGDYFDFYWLILWPAQYAAPRSWRSEPAIT